MSNMTEKTEKAPVQEKKGSGKVAVVAAIAGNILVGVVKFIAAAISSSSAMLTEGIHSIVDSGNGVLVLLGLHRSKKEPDYLHPFGYGKELYFWTLVVSLFIFLLGGGVSIYEGIVSLHEAQEGVKELGNVVVNYVVLIAAAIIEGSSLFVAVRQFNAARGEVPPLSFIKDTKDPSLFTVVLEDSAAELGLLFAFVAQLIMTFTGNLYADGIASILIGLLLCVVSVVLLTETKGLLVGEGMKHQSLDEIREMVESDERVVSCGRILSMYMGPDSLLITIDATFHSQIKADDVLQAIDDIERRISQRWPQTKAVFIEVESMRNCIAQQLEESQWEDEDEDDEPEEILDV